MLIGLITFEFCLLIYALIYLCKE